MGADWETIFTAVIGSVKNHRAMLAACITALIAFSFLPPAALAWTAVEPSTARWSLSALVFFVTVAAWNFGEWLVFLPSRTREKIAAEEAAKRLREMKAN